MSYSSHCPHSVLSGFISLPSFTPLKRKTVVILMGILLASSLGERKKKIVKCTCFMIKCTVGKHKWMTRHMKFVNIWFILYYLRRDLRKSLRKTFCPTVIWFLPDFKIWAGIRIISLNVYSETMKAIKKGGHS